jgi:Holliday junction resolvasome RuvABC endonuclease subunit
MPLILGLDASIRKAGFCVVDTDAPPFTIVERGRLYTTVADGIPIQRLLKQQKQIRELLERHSIDFVSMEAPYFGDGESERLYALNQFLHAVFLDRGTFVIAFPPQQLKKLAIPEKYSDEVHKAQMVAAAKQQYNLIGKPLTDDEADAMHAARLGWLFYNWHFKKTLSEKDMHPLIWKAFDGKKVYKRGVRKGIEIYTGLIYRENDLFFDFKRVKERKCKIAPLPEDKET